MKFWKKVLASVTAWVLCVGSVGVTGLQGVLESVGTVLSASAYVPDYYDGTYRDLYYIDHGDSIGIVGCNKNVTSIEIPKEIDGKNLTEIGSSAFEGCTSLTEITIPDSVTSIGQCAFDGCTSLTEITIPDSVTSIGGYAFYNTLWLSEKRKENPLVIVNGILIDAKTCIGSVTIPESVTSIGEFAFLGCKGLTGITIPEGVTSIGVGAFQGCENLTEITIPEGVTRIESIAFTDCENLTEVTISDSVTSIGNSAFLRCTSLTSIMIPDSMTSTDNVTSIDGVTSIGEEAFKDCTNLTSIMIPGGATEIEYRAFENCTSLASITIPANMTRIAYDVFFDCINLKNVYISDLKSWCKIDFGTKFSNPLCRGANLYVNGESVSKLTIPDGVTSIGEYTFDGCTSLTEITIPESVESTGICSFKGTGKIKLITYDNTNLKSLKRNCFDSDYDSGEHKNCNVLVATNVTSLEVKSKEGKIPAAAYQSCCHLKEVTLEEGITLIEDDSFANCDNLEKIVIPKSVTGIRYTAFTYDTKLTIYGYKDTYAEKYAEIFGFPFVALDDSDTPPVTTTTTTATTETTPTTATPITGGLVCGDINLDGRVDITDAVLLNKFCSGAITLDDTAKKNADCNGDGEPGSGDAVVLLQFLVHIVDTLPYSA